MKALETLKTITQENQAKQDQLVKEILEFLNQAQVRKIWVSYNTSHSYSSQRPFQEVIQTIDFYRANLEVLHVEQRKYIALAKSEVIEPLLEFLPKTQAVPSGKNGKTATGTAPWLSELQKAIDQLGTLRTPYTGGTNTIADAYTNAQRGIEAEKQREVTRRQEEVLEEQNTWARTFLTERMPEKAVKMLDRAAAIKLALDMGKTEYAEAEEITGDKCYCQDHGEDRHYHYVESTWDSSAKCFTFYETSERY